VFVLRKLCPAEDDAEGAAAKMIFLHWSCTDMAGIELLYGVPKL